MDMSIFDKMYDTNLERGDSQHEVYWRARYKLQDDPIASMLAESTRNSLADAWTEGLTVNGKARFRLGSLRPYAKSLIRRTPLSIMRDEAIDHLAHVLYSSAVVDEGV